MLEDTDSELEGPTDMPVSRTLCLEIVQLLLARGADVNAADHDGMTPLHRLAEVPTER